MMVNRYSFLLLFVFVFFLISETLKDFFLMNDTSSMLKCMPNSFLDHIMSDIFTSDLSDGDNLVEFLTKFARFGIDQCLHFTHLITNQQRLIELNHFLMEIQSLQNEFYEILVVISSSDDSMKQLLFVKLQNYLSNFMEINFRFKSFDLLNRRDIPLNNVEQCERRLSTISLLSTIPQITISSSDEMIDNGKNWKFANIIHTRFQMSLIASNARDILCYNNQNYFLHFLLITGQFQGNIKWNFKSIIDMLW